MKIRNTLFKLNSDMDGGGGVPSPAPGGGSAAPAAAPTAPATANPPGLTGSSPMEKMHADMQALRSKPAQPPQNGEQQSLEASEDEGAEPGNEENPDTTTDAGDDEAGDGKGVEQKGWTDEDVKALQAHKWDKLPHSPEAAALLKAHRELRSQFDRVSSSNSNILSRNTALEAALHSGDLKELQNMGFDLKVDQRTPEVMVQELEEEWAGIKSVFEPIIAELMAEFPEAAGKVKAGALKRLEAINAKAAVIQREQEKQSWQAEVLQQAGVKPDSKSAYEKMSGQAEANLTALTQQDPDAPKYFAELKEATKPGGALHALGVNLAKAYGTSPQTAKTMNDIGKGLYLAKNQEKILADARKAWEKDAEKRGGMRGSRGTAPQTGAPTTLPPSIARIGAAMQARMPQR